MFKKALLGAAIASTMMVGVAQAASETDNGIELGVQYANTDLKVNGTKVAKDESNFRVFGQFENSTDSIPNALLEYSTKGNSTFGYNQLSGTGYYKLVDGGVVSLDAGLGLSQFSSIQFLAKHSSEVVPHTYFGLDLGTPDSDASIFVDTKAYVAADVTGYDLRTGVNWEPKFGEMPVEVGFTVGYEFSDLKFKDAANLKSKTNGLFAGVMVSF